MNPDGTPTPVTPVDATTEPAEPKPDSQQLVTETHEKYVNIWKASAYTNLRMMRYIISHKYPDSEKPWTAFLGALDASTASTAKDDNCWELATACKKSVFQMYGRKPPVWSNSLDYLWEDGIGLCTSLAIAVNEASNLDANYADYKNRGHRAAHKHFGDDDPIIIIDSGAKKVFQLAPKEVNDQWKNTGKDVSYRDVGFYSFLSQALVTCVLNTMSRTRRHH
jgi:hypothetical protein